MRKVRLQSSWFLSLRCAAACCIRKAILIRENASDGEAQHEQLGDVVHGVLYGKAACEVTCVAPTEGKG